MEKKQQKFYTGSGDAGLTSLLPGSQVSKADERVAAIGGVEEIVSALGMVKTVTACPVFRAKIERMQKTLRTLAAGLADPRSGKFVFSAEEITFLENDMDGMLSKLSEESVESMRDALPGGCEQSARLDVARSVARRAERDLVAMDRRYSVPTTFKIYINRICDYLGVAARYADYLDQTAPKAADPAPVAPAIAPVAQGSVESIVAQVVSHLGGAKMMNLGKAAALIESVEARALAEGKQAVVAVVNAEGNPVAVHVMDGAFLVSYEVAVKKAYTAVAVKMPTMELSKLVQPGGTFYGLQNLDKIVTFGGGIPLVVDGVIVGGLGVSGGTGEEDHALAQFGASVFPTL